MQDLVSINWSIVFQLLNTIIIFVVLRKLLFKPVTEFMEKRQKGIEDSILDAEAKNKEAEALMAQYEQRLNDIKQERNEIIKEATKRAEERGGEIVKKAEAEAKKLLEKASVDIQREKQKALNELKEQMSELVIMAAAKVINKELDANQHDEIIKQFIDEVGEAKWQN
ncbi:F0F1 ATP synthase subunit B [Alkaliphilus crotonatoxidans]